MATITKQAPSPAKTARKSRGWTLQDVSDMTGITVSRLSQIERGVGRPSRETARALYALYEGSVDIGAIYDPEVADQGMELFMTDSAGGDTGQNPSVAHHDLTVAE